METKLLSEFYHLEEFRGIEGYQKHGGYEVLKKALKMQPQQIIDEVKASGLRGRGGAGARRLAGVEGEEAPAHPRAQGADAAVDLAVLPVGVGAGAAQGELDGEADVGPHRGAGRGAEDELGGGEVVVVVEVAGARRPAARWRWGPSGWRAPDRARGGGRPRSRRPSCLRLRRPRIAV